MLLPLSFGEMKDLGNKLWEEAMQIKFNAQKIAWYMRGGISFTDIMNMSPPEIENLNKIIDKNIEITKETKLPFF